jgi:outer membrane protein TolC
VALRREGLINARSFLEQTGLRLRRLLNCGGAEVWTLALVLKDQPVVVSPDVKLDELDEHVQAGLRLRADLNQAVLGVRRGELEIVKTRNGLLPKMDLFISLGKSGYADAFGDSVRKWNGDYYDAQASLVLELPLGNRDARARHQRALLNRDQAQEAVANLRQLVELDIRSAYIEVKRAAEQAAATAVTRKHQEEALQAEKEKFQVGKSTTLLVAQAESNLLVSQIAEAQAAATRLKALVELYRLEGSLLRRRGIAAPGGEPVK